MFDRDLNGPLVLCYRLLLFSLNTLNNCQYSQNFLESKTFRKIGNFPLGKIRMQRIPNTFLFKQKEVPVRRYSTKYFALKNFEEFPGKHLRWKKRLQDGCFLVNFVLQITNW